MAQSLSWATEKNWARPTKTATLLTAWSPLPLRPPLSGLARYLRRV